jgi:hypothetical protein
MSTNANREWRNMIIDPDLTWADYLLLALLAVPVIWAVSGIIVLTRNRKEYDAAMRRACAPKKKRASRFRNGN